MLQFKGLQRVGHDWVTEQTNGLLSTLCQGAAQSFLEVGCEHPSPSSSGGVSRGSFWPRGSRCGHSAVAGVRTHLPGITSALLPDSLVPTLRRFPAAALSLSEML